MTKLNILVIHGYVQSASTVSQHTSALRSKLSDIANLYYVDGPPTSRRDDNQWSARPWWLLANNLQFDSTPAGKARWTEVLRWWSNHLSENQYDGIVGLSQGSAMAALLISMIKTPGAVEGFELKMAQPIKFAILCSGFVSELEPHRSMYRTSSLDLPTLHTVDMHDMIVPAARTIALQKLFPSSKLMKHSEGHRIPVMGDWPATMRTFIEESR